VTNKILLANGHLFQSIDANYERLHEYLVVSRDLLACRATAWAFAYLQLVWTER